MNLTGTRDVREVMIHVINTTNGGSTDLSTLVSYPTSTTWSVSVPLIINYDSSKTVLANSFNIYGMDSSNAVSQGVIASIYQHKIADIDGKLDSATHSQVGLTDLSLLAIDYLKDTSQGAVLNNPLTDMDGDGKVGLTELSLLATHYGDQSY